MKRIIYLLAALPLMMVSMTACGDDDDVDRGLSVIKDSQTPQNALDKWLVKNYVEPYNIELRYRWEDNETSMDYILVPPRYINAIRMANILKYICFESFDQVTGSTKFIRDHFPKLVHLVGNPGWNSSGGWMSQGSYVLGSSEGGYKINLWYVNHLSDQLFENYVPTDSVIRSRKELNSVFFHTIIHEFGHVFHQKVPYSNEFNQITGTDYLGGMWSSSFTSPDDPAIHAGGFVTAYAAESADEDFAEMFSTYICSTKEEYDEILHLAGVRGRDILNAKMLIIRDYFEKNWDLDIDALRDEVQRREANLANVNFDELK